MERLREWTPHMWEGLDAFAWARLLTENRFRVHWSKAYVAAIVTPVSAIHTAFHCVQNALLGGDITRTPIKQSPLFILGHWRSGTTYLHELLIRDSRHAFPNYYECFAPNHFLLTGSWFPWLVPWMMPSRRPMDNMASGWDRPQEDEFATCMLGMHSPYRRIGFPNEFQKPDCYDLSDLTPTQRKHWQRRFQRFIRELTYQHRDERLVLKSPPHTARIPYLVELFPDARFVYIARDPYALYPSTIRLWKTLYKTHGLQKPNHTGLEESVLGTFEHLFERYQAGKDRIAPNRLVELKYEDLIQNPIEQLQRIYQKLELGEFQPARKAVESYLACLKQYETNRYTLTPEAARQVTERCGEYSRYFGYEVRQA